MILLASGRRKLFILDITTRKIHAFHAYIFGCDKFKWALYYLLFMQTNIYIARKTSINVYIHLSVYWSGRKLKKIELSRTIKFSVFQTILDKTLETIPANITKLLNIDKTNFVSPLPPSSML
jgi:hypothetical protein